MNLILAALIFLTAYLLLGTFFFALLERTSIPKRVEVFVLTFGHPALTILLAWFACSQFNHDVAMDAAMMASGSLLAAPFSTAKYLTSLKKNDHEISIDYITPLLRNKTMIVPLEQVKNSEISNGNSLLNKPTIFKLTVGEDMIKFYALEPYATN